MAFALILPASPISVVLRAGLLFHLMPVSVQVFEPVYSAGPSAVALLPAVRRSFALWIGPVMPGHREAQVALGHLLGAAADEQ